MSVVMVSAQGQIVLPQDVRRALGLYEGDRLGVILQENRLVLTPLVSSSQRGWRRWRGSLAGTRALQEHLADGCGDKTSEVCESRPKIGALPQNIGSLPALLR